MTFVKEGRAPLDHLLVDLLDDLCAKRLVAPVRQREPSAESGLVLLHDFSDSIVQRKRKKYLLQLTGKCVDQRPVGIIQLIIKRFHRRSTKSLSQTGAQDGAVRNGVGSDGDMLIDDSRPECVVEMSGPDSTGLEVLPIQMAGKIAVAAHKLLPPLDGFFERQIFNAV